MTARRLRSALYHLLFGQRRYVPAAGTWLLRLREETVGAALGGGAAQPPALPTRREAVLGRGEALLGRPRSPAPAPPPAPPGTGLTGPRSSSPCALRPAEGTFSPPRPPPPARVSSAAPAGVVKGTPTRTALSPACLLGHLGH